MFQDFAAAFYFNYRTKAASDLSLILWIRSQHRIWCKHSASI